VHQCDGAEHVRIAQVGKILVHLHRHEHALVDDRPGGHAGDIPVLIDPGPTDLAGRPLVDQVQLAVEGLFVGAVGGALEEQLPHLRLAVLGRLAQGRVIGRHVAPADGFHALFTKDFFKYVPGAVAFRCIGRGKDHADAVVCRFGQLHPQQCADLVQKLVRHLQEDAGAVAGIGLTAAGAAMIKIDKHGQCLLDDLVGLFALHVGDESDAAGIVLELGIVEALLFGCSVVFHLVTFTSDFF